MERKKKETRGKFIVFEGSECSGKTTQAALLLHNLEKRCKKFPILTKEPTVGTIGKFIREELLTGNITIDEKSLNELFTGDRLDHILKPDGILSYLNNSIDVISDRHYLSSMVYYAMNSQSLSEYINAFDHMWKSNKVNRDLCKADLTIFIDIDEDVFAERVRKRKDNDMYDNIEVFRKTRNAYYQAIDYASSNGDNIVIVDGNGSMVDVSNSIFEIVCRHIGFKIKAGGKN